MSKELCDMLAMAINLVCGIGCIIASFPVKIAAERKQDLFGRIWSAELYVVGTMFLLTCRA